MTVLPAPAPGPMEAFASGLQQTMPYINQARQSALERAQRAAEFATTTDLQRQEQARLATEHKESLAASVNEGVLNRLQSKQQHTENYDLALSNGKTQGRLEEMRIKLQGEGNAADKANYGFTSVLALYKAADETGKKAINAFFVSKPDAFAAAGIVIPPGMRFDTYVNSLEKEQDKLTTEYLKTGNPKLLERISGLASALSPSSTNSMNATQQQVLTKGLAGGTLTKNEQMFFDKLIGADKNGAFAQLNVIADNIRAEMSNPALSTEEIGVLMKQLEAVNKQMAEIKDAITGDTSLSQSFIETPVGATPILKAQRPNYESVAWQLAHPFQTIGGAVNRRSVNPLAGSIAANNPNARAAALQRPQVIIPRQAGPQGPPSNPMADFGAAGD